MRCKAATEPIQNTQAKTDPPPSGQTEGQTGGNHDR